MSENDKDAAMPTPTSCREAVSLSRRSLLGTGASLALWSLIPRTASAQGRDPRFLTVILRGGLDGLALAAPVGDPDHVRIRGAQAIPGTGDRAGLPLDSLFALNAGMPVLHGLFRQRQALVVHAVATPYRSRSHFDGQDVLESGLPGVARVEDGWLNRALASLPAAGSAAPQKGLAMGAVVPLVMRGKAPVLSWIPKTGNLPLRESTVARLLDLYNVTDPRLARAFADGLEIDRISAAAYAMPAAGGPEPAAPAPAPAEAPAVVTSGLPPPPRPFRDLVEPAETAARFLAAADGPRVGALSYNGWDTHANAGIVEGQLAGRLAGLDAAIRALRDGLGPVWKDTVVAVVTEFGRTARVNGTAGTDHGTATTALLVGGAVAGGRVIADWPGLADAALFEARDLKPTLDLRAVMKGVLRDHLGVPDAALADAVFPESRAVRAMGGLVA